MKHFLMAALYLAIGTLAVLPFTEQRDNWEYAAKQWERNVREYHTSLNCPQGCVVIMPPHVFPVYRAVMEPRGPTPYEFCKDHGFRHEQYVYDENIREFINCDEFRVNGAGGSASGKIPHNINDMTLEPDPSPRPPRSED